MFGEQIEHDDEVQFERLAAATLLHVVLFGLLARVAQERRGLVEEVVERVGVEVAEREQHDVRDLLDVLDLVEPEHRHEQLAEQVLRRELRRARAERRDRAAAASRAARAGCVAFARARTDVRERAGRGPPALAARERHAAGEERVVEERVQVVVAFAQRRLLLLRRAQNQRRRAALLHLHTTGTARTLKYRYTRGTSTITDN